MKLIYKLFIFLTVIIISVNTSFAFTNQKIDKLIEKSDLSKTSTIAISVRNVSTGNVVYEKDAKKLLHPASTIKIPASYFAINTLGYDYFFKTGFYKYNKDLYIKLGADPLLTFGQLKSAFSQLKSQGLDNFENLYIDDSIIDKKEFSQGWMWDDDVNPYTPKVSAYNLDGNSIKLNMTTKDDGTVKTSLNSKYPMSIYAYIKKDANGEFLDVNRYNWNNPELVEIYGKVNNTQSVKVPISSMRRYFIYNIDKILDEKRITVKSSLYASKIIPQNADLIYEISNPIEPVISEILQNSNNLMAETIYKLAGGMDYNSTGTDENAFMAMAKFYQKDNVDFNSVVLKDGCGVSRNNLVSVDWMSNILIKIYKDKNFEKFKEYMAQPGDGTLSSRLFDLRGDAWLKTGSLSNISALAGYIKSKDGNLYAITIYTQNFKLNQKEVKKFEDEIVTLIYNR